MAVKQQIRFGELQLNVKYAITMTVGLLFAV